MEKRKKTSVNQKLALRVCQLNEEKFMIKKIGVMILVYSVVAVNIGGYS